MQPSFKYTIAPESGFKNILLDSLLAAGFYRMQHIMFTCNETAINEDSITIPVFWLRTLAQQYKLNNSAAKILKKCARFSVSIKPAAVDIEIEELYKKYKSHITFNAAKTCADYLHQEAIKQPFDSWMIQIRDHDLLIAAGYFDKGDQSIAGIINIYHPLYHACSLGKFLMLLKLRYAKEHNMLYYYTGYISPNSTRFDYKVFPDINAVEVLLPFSQQWTAFNKLSKTFLSGYYQFYKEPDT